MKKQFVFVIWFSTTEDIELYINRNLSCGFIVEHMNLSYHERKISDKYYLLSIIFIKGRKKLNKRTNK